MNSDSHKQHTIISIHRWDDGKSRHYSSGQVLQFSNNILSSPCFDNGLKYLSNDGTIFDTSQFHIIPSIDSEHDSDENAHYIAVPRDPKWYDVEDPPAHPTPPPPTPIQCPCNQDCLVCWWEDPASNCKCDCLFPDCAQPTPPPAPTPPSPRGNCNMDYQCVSGASPEFGKFPSIAECKKKCKAPPTPPTPKPPPAPCTDKGLIETPYYRPDPVSWDPSEPKGTSGCEELGSDKDSDGNYICDKYYTPYKNGYTCHFNEDLNICKPSVVSCILSPTPKPCSQCTRNAKSGGEEGDCDFACKGAGYDEGVCPWANRNSTNQNECCKCRPKPTPPPPPTPYTGKWACDPNGMNCVHPDQCSDHVYHNCSEYSTLEQCMTACSK